jgi:prevent-host-death family protein
LTRPGPFMNGGGHQRNGWRRQDARSARRARVQASKGWSQAMDGILGTDRPPPGSRIAAATLGMPSTAVGSSSATIGRVSHIAQKELRNHVSEVLRRAEAGETLTVTVAGRPVAELGPVHRRRWVGGTALARVWRGQAPRSLDADLERLPAGVIDPFVS